jgi:hypothetical protein
VLRGLDDHDEIAGGRDFGTGEKHPTDSAPLGLCPGKAAGIVVRETSAQHLLPVGSI